MEEWNIIELIKVVKPGIKKKITLGTLKHAPLQTITFNLHILFNLLFQIEVW